MSDGESEGGRDQSQRYASKWTKSTIEMIFNHNKGFAFAFVSEFEPELGFGFGFDSADFGADIDTNADLDHSYWYLFHWILMYRRHWEETLDPVAADIED